ncbi:MAG TPA: SGNH/GDSL hydrolase family protein [Cyclobacteriaceae bacterium]|jgi:lysophospholipase L1-like esterase|nr:SGNH/GDSL hydrolase family protein [Cyclobacteriaceae bacterium]
MISPNRRKDASTVVGQNIVTDQASRMATSGGALATLDADLQRTFVTNLMRAGIWNKIIDCKFLGTGGFSGCLDKLQFGDPSFKKLLNTGFVSGNYSSAGLLSASVNTKYLDTQIVPGLYGLNRNDFSMGCFMSQDESTPNQYLMCDNNVSGRCRLSLTKGNFSIISDSNTTNISRTLCERKVTDPYFIGFSLDTNIHLMENFQQVLGSDTAQVSVTTNSLTMDTNIRLLRGRDSGSEIGGCGQMAFYWIGHAMTYAEMITLQKEVKKVLIGLSAYSETSETICFGDSNTFGQGAAFTARFPYVLAGLNGNKEVNFGLPSSQLRQDVTNVAGGYQRYLQLDNTNILNSKIYVMYGTNDMTNGSGAAVINDFISKLTTIVNHWISLGVSVSNIVLASPIPRYDGVTTQVQTDYRDAVNTVAHNTGVKYFNAYQKIIDNGGSSNYQGDNIHLLAAGHTLIANGLFSEPTFV